ncbi:MAG: hypothetical protein UR93_C0020G0008, partial [Berkelbacteria bacterium GW2011_GWA2_35_9]
LGSGPNSQFGKEVEEKIPGAKVVSLDVGFNQENKLTIENKLISLFTKLPFKDQSFDIIVSSAAMPLYLHNQDQLTDSFQQIVRVLRKGGSAYFAPLTYTDIISLDKTKSVYDTHKQHNYFESKKIIEKILQTIEGISYQFIPDEYINDPQDLAPGEQWHKPSVLVINKLINT